MVHPISDIVGWSPRYFSKKTNLIFLMKTSSIKLGKKKNSTSAHYISDCGSSKMCNRALSEGKAQYNRLNPQAKNKRWCLAGSMT